MTYSDDAAKRDQVEVLTEEEVPVQFREQAMYAHERSSQANTDAILAFRDWRHETHTFYYARPRELFSEFEARDLAVKHHCTRLILEDMS